MANHEPNEKGVYPDWADKDYVFKYPEVKIVNTPITSSKYTATLPSIGFKTDTP
jgi:hypothetical protein